VVIICLVIQLWLLAVFVRIVLSWFPAVDGGMLATVSRLLRNVTDPVLEPVRRMLPPVRMGAMGLDLSPMVVLLVGYLLLGLLCR
jgi:YggT family protein